VLLKRYLEENGTQTADAIFEKAEEGELTLVFSLWNIGEVLGVLDEKRRRKNLSEKEFKDALNSFAGELVKLMRLKTLQVIPVLTPLLTGTWELVMSHHIYEADALQITTCIQNENSVLVSGDQKLVMQKKGLEALHNKR